MSAVPSFDLSMQSMWFIFEGSLDFQWGPHNDEPMIISNKITQLTETLKDMELPMFASRQIVADDMEDRFNRQVDINGNPWKKRSAKYQRWLNKHGYGGKTILRKDDDLFDAVTDPDSYVVVNDDMFINTAFWPVYWHAQDQGSVVGKGVKLPQRQFVGVSERGQFAILAVFDEWLDNSLDIINPGITHTAMFRGAFGHIGGRVGLNMPPGRPRLGILGQVTGPGSVGP